MCFRTYKNTDLTVSEVGFGMWTISTGWWGNYTEGEALALMHKAFDLGITLFDAADTAKKVTFSACRVSTSVIEGDRTGLTTMIIHRKTPAVIPGLFRHPSIPQFPYFPNYPDDPTTLITKLSNY